MNKKRKMLYLSRIMVCLSFLFFGLSGLAQASSLSIDIQGSRIYVHAKQVPLINILQAISDRTGIFLETSEPMKQPVSVDFKGVTVEKLIKRLLANQSYSLIFKKTAEGDFIPTGLRIFGSGTMTAYESGSRLQSKDEISQPQNESPTVESTPTDPLASVPDHVFDRYEKGWFTRAFQETDELLEQISSVSTIQEPDLPETLVGNLPVQPSPETSRQDSGSGGIVVGNLSQQSALSTIGLENGDIIRNVNGQQVETTEQFINVLQNISTEPTRIKIDRFKKSGVIYPIYIELQQSGLADNTDPLGDSQGGTASSPLVE